MQLLLLILFISAMPAEEVSFPVRQDSYGDFQPDQHLGNEAPRAPFSSSLTRIVRFYPPRDSEETPFIRLNPSASGRLVPRKIRILTDDEDLSFTLPYFSPAVPVYIKISPGTHLLGLELPDDSTAADKSFSFLSPPPGGFFLQINPEDPDTLLFSPPPSDRQGDTFYSLELNISREIRIIRPSEDDLLLKPFSTSRKIVLYPGIKEPGEESDEDLIDENNIWKISPLDALESISFERREAPAFPSALPEVMSAVLWRTRNEWRNPDFELYSWAAFPSILIWDCLNYDIQNRFFQKTLLFC